MPAILAFENNILYSMTMNNLPKINKLKSLLTLRFVAPDYAKDIHEYMIHQRLHNAKKQAIRYKEVTQYYGYRIQLHY